MSRKNCLVKVSGDMLSDNVFQWIKKLSKKYFVVVCVGGGTQISKAFKKSGLPVGDFGLLGRELKTFPERQLARDILEKNQVRIQDRLDKIGACVGAVIPALDIGTVLCHVNGDQFLLTAYHGFDILYAVTTPQRIPQKKKLFAPYPKIKVVGFKS